MVADGIIERTLAWDSRRAHELSHYVRSIDLVPGGSSVKDDEAFNISSGLAPICQLVAVCCKAPRAMLNVMDHDTMYFLSNASISPGNDTADVDEDPVIRACSGAVPLDGRVCEMTIRQTPSATIPTFVVNDLSQSRFSQLDSVRGPPHFRFYAGTPLTTREGINIGSLAILDTQPRDGITRAEEQHLVRLAAQAMFHLEVNRQAIEGRRSLRLAKSLELFIAGQKSMVAAEPEIPIKISNTYALPLSLQNPDTPDGGAWHDKRHSSEESREDNRQSSEESLDKNGASIDSNSIRRSHIFERAANLLREGLGGLCDDASVVFVRLKSRLIKTHSNDTSHVEAFAASTAAKPFASGDDLPRLRLEEQSLGEMIRRYPEGRLFSFDEPESTTDEDAAQVIEQSARRSRKAKELQTIRAAFPHANQVLFSPLWDSDVSTYAHAVFATNSSGDLSLSSAHELAHLRSFCSNVVSECNRAEILKAEKQKSDFVSTISHEMRSPLHGVLACAELMRDTDLTSYQRSLSETVGSCGRTLLETINDVLEFSKINTFRKNWQAENRRTFGLGAKRHYLGTDQGFTPAAPTLLQLTSLVDLNVILEEVVDAVVHGRSFAPPPDVTGLNRQGSSSGTDGRASMPKDEPQVILDVQKADWSFISQPGAIRRIVLNIAGNSLKYTTKGYVRIYLELSETHEYGESAMVLTVIDTGRGISRAFLDSLLFVPFSQEDSLAPGTGLGLSMVHNIVTMLGGDINVQSEVGQGTTVKVIIPLRRPIPGQISIPASQNGSIGSLPPFHLDEAIPRLQNHAGKPRAMFCRLTERNDELQSILSRYLHQWYDFDAAQQVNEADVVVVEQDDIIDLANMLKSSSEPSRTSVIIIIGCVQSRIEDLLLENLEQCIAGAVEWVARPVGPRKLANSIRCALQRIAARKRKSGDARSSPTVFQISDHEAKVPANTTAAQIGMAERLDELVATQLKLEEQIDPPQILSDSETRIRRPTLPVEKAQSSPHLLRYSEGDQGATYDLRSTDQKEDEVLFSEAHIPAKLSQAVGKTIEDINLDGTDRGSNPYILVVDDNRINSSLLKNFLAKRRRYTNIECAENGQEAVELVKCAQGSHDIIFMDISMPIMNGFEATRRIREFERLNKKLGASGSLVIALTGLASNRDQAEGFESGMDIYLTKPVSLKAVGHLLDDWEARRRV
jgi:signal transduction histidine kinase/CheY-like chemotaxis protein